MARIARLKSSLRSASLGLCVEMLAPYRMAKAIGNFLMKNKDQFMKSLIPAQEPSPLRQHDDDGSETWINKASESSQIQANPGKSSQIVPMNIVLYVFAHAGRCRASSYPLKIGPKRTELEPIGVNRSNRKKSSPQSAYDLRGKAVMEREPAGGRDAPAQADLRPIGFAPHVCEEDGFLLNFSGSRT